MQEGLQTCDLDCVEGAWLEKIHFPFLPNELTLLSFPLSLSLSPFSIPLLGPRLFTLPELGTPGLPAWCRLIYHLHAI